MFNQKDNHVEQSEDGHTEIELLTIKEAAEFLRVSVSLIRRLQQGRGILFIKVGGSIRFNKRDLVEYLPPRKHSKNPSPFSAYGSRESASSFVDIRNAVRLKKNHWKISFAGFAAWQH
jgi:excisionase family DNA binding protein